MYVVIESNLQRSSYIIPPYSTFKFAWDILQIIMILFIGVLVPFNIAFGLGSFPIVLLALVEANFIIDILVSMNCGYQTKGMLIMMRKHIMIRYLKSWFISDFLSAIPVFTLFYLSLGDNIYLTADALITYHTGKVGIRRS